MRLWPLLVLVYGIHVHAVEMVHSLSSSYQDIVSQKVSRITGTAFVFAKGDKLYAATAAHISQGSARQLKLDGFQIPESDMVRRCVDTGLDLEVIELRSGSTPPMGTWDAKARKVRVDWLRVSTESALLASGRPFSRQLLIPYGSWSMSGGLSNSFLDLADVRRLPFTGEIKALVQITPGMSGTPLVSREWDQKMGYVEGVALRTTKGFPEAFFASAEQLRDLIETCDRGDQPTSRAKWEIRSGQLFRKWPSCEDLPGPAKELGNFNGSDGGEGSGSSMSWPDYERQFLSPMAMLDRGWQSGLLVQGQAVLGFAAQDYDMSVYSNHCGQLIGDSQTIPRMGADFFDLVEERLIESQGSPRSGLNLWLEKTGLLRISLKGVGLLEDEIEIRLDRQGRLVDKVGQPLLAQFAPILPVTTKSGEEGWLDVRSLFFWNPEEWSVPWEDSSWRGPERSRPFVRVKLRHTPMIQTFLFDGVAREH
ncbi:MAG: hypothetical protein AB7F86_13280 [Bdellovibrionales bacterium]